MSRRVPFAFAKCVRLVVGLMIVVACLPALRSKSDEPARTGKPAVGPMLGKEAGDVRDDNELKMKLVWCLPGSFFMRDETADASGALTVTRVEVLLSRGFWLGRYEVTQSEWNRLMGTEPWKGRHRTMEEPDVAATSISWLDAMEFCRKLTDEERKAGRLPKEWEYTLPTEAQWERACRAQTETAYSFGDDDARIGDYAWFNGNAWLGEDLVCAHPVGRKRPNPWGLYDMHGNALEWCRDFYRQNLPLPGGRDPEMTEKDPGKRTLKVARGGNFAEDSRCACSHYRWCNDHDERNVGIGFRVALSPVRPAK